MIFYDHLNCLFYPSSIHNVDFPFSSGCFSFGPGIPCSPFNPGSPSVTCSPFSPFVPLHSCNPTSPCGLCVIRVMSALIGLTM